MTLDKLTEKTDSLTVSEGLKSAFSGLKKKKKKPVESSFVNDEAGDIEEDLDEHAVESEEAEAIVLQTLYPLKGSHTIMNMRSCLVGFSIFFKRIIQNWQGIGEGQL